MRKETMMDKGGQQRRKAAVKLSDLVGKTLEPLVARRGFAMADLLASWPEIVGPDFAAFSAPEKILWPRERAEEFAPGVLIVRAEGPRAIHLQHEVGQIVERINAFFGYAAIAQARIVQGPVGKRRVEAEKSPAPPVDEPALAAAVAPVEDAALRAALERLGREVLARPFKEA